MPRRESTTGALPEADYLFQVILDRLRNEQKDLDEDRLRQAYELALAAHEGQQRKDGSPYIIHPLEVSEICVDLNMDEDAIITALLHDTVEDTGVRLQQIRQLFGRDVASMVDALTKIKRIDFFARFTGRNKASEQARNLQKLFVAMTRDTRVIVVKLADRLHNMRTLGAMVPEKRQRISRETLEFYIPIARRLGFGQLVSEMEDYVFQFLLPDVHAELEKLVDTAAQAEEKHIPPMIVQIRKLLRSSSIVVEEIYGRRKHLFSIYQKMQRQSVDLDGIYDLIAIRIILGGDVLECYRALGVLHQQYKPIFHRFRDFIASPKENGYQTLHTTVITPEGHRVEIQIRTVAMDLQATKGIAAHWEYKEAGARRGHLIKDDAWMEFIRELSEEDMDSAEFVARTRDTLLGDQVLVLSPKGEVVNLPVGSTPIDFAYYIHTELGHSMRSAKVNGSMVPLDYQLRNGDVIEVMKSADGDGGPRPEWLVLAKSPKSLIKIRRYFRARPRNERINIGRNLLRQHIVKEGLYPLNLMANDKLALLLKMLPVRSIDDLYDKIAEGHFQCEDVVNHLKQIHRSRVVDAPGASAASAAEHAVVGGGLALGIHLAGGQPLTRRAEIMRCCTPVPGDKIYGLLDRETRRLQVHRVECPRMQQALGESELVTLDWSPESKDKRYPAHIGIISLNRVGLLFEVLRYLSSEKINLGSMEFNMAPTVTQTDRSARFDLTIEVADTEELALCLNEIAKLDDVFDAHRIMLPGEPAPERAKPAAAPVKPPASSISPSLREPELEPEPGELPE
jgi:GTP diphosphokinase / guanosine-3',5'-bis(diphosphate) 3'-diphosphatase